MEDIAYGEPARTRRCERSNDEPLREVKAVRRAVEQVKAEVGAEFALMKESLRQLQLDRADSGSSGSESSPAEPPTASRLDRPLPSPGSSKLSRNGKVQIFSTAWLDDAMSELQQTKESTCYPMLCSNEDQQVLNLAPLALRPH